MNDTVRLSRIDAEQNMRRFYRISVQPGLFGDCCVVREWGRIGTRGQSMEEWFANEADAHISGDALTRQKQRRGYKAVQ